MRQEENHGGLEVLTKIERDGKMRIKIKGIRDTDIEYIDSSGAQQDVDTVANDVHKLFTRELNNFITKIDAEVKKNFGFNIGS